MSNKLMIFGSNRKIGRMSLFGRKSSWLKRIRVMTQGRREVEVGIALLSNDEKNFNDKNVLSYF